MKQKLLWEEYQCFSHVVCQPLVVCFATTFRMGSHSFKRFEFVEQAQLCGSIHMIRRILINSKGRCRPQDVWRTVINQLFLKALCDYHLRNSLIWLSKQSKQWQLSRPNAVWCLQSNGRGCVRADLAEGRPSWDHLFPRKKKSHEWSMTALKKLWSSVSLSQTR